MKKKFKENPGITNDELESIPIDIPNNSKRSLIKNYRNTIQSRSATPIIVSENEQKRQNLLKKLGIKEENENEPLDNDNDKDNDWKR